MKKIFFPNLNGLRFIAAFLVLIHHLEHSKERLGLPNHWTSPSISLLGRHGVTLFFVLSGFLITYLLLTEKKTTGTISVRNFYFRRILRIWPLYYFIFILGFFILPKIGFLNIGMPVDGMNMHFWLNAFLFIFFLPNLALSIFPPIPYISQSWSVGVEEQFYLIWPLLIKKSKNTERMFMSIIGLCIIISFSLYFFRKGGMWNRELEIIFDFWDRFNIDCMAIGGLFALYLFHNDKKKDFLFRPAVQIVNILLLIFLIVKGVHIPYLHYQFYATLFGILILNLAANEKRIFSLEYKALDYLGKISFGIYMYHPLAIALAMKTLMHFGKNFLALQILLSLIVTVIFSAISYEILEKPFIRRKVRYSKIVSGDNVDHGILK